MARYSYERLSPESASLLELESSRCFAHAASTQIFELGPLATAHGGIDFPAVRSAIESQLHLAPRCRKKLRWIPYENHPVWVDDPEFNLDYHVRHTSLPQPGSPEQLRRMAARIHAQRLDRSRPLWECWVIEGLGAERFAMILKIHHCMVEGASGADLLQVLLSPDPSTSDAYGDPPPYRPRPVPSGLELALDEVVRRARLPRQALERLRRFATESESLQDELGARASAVARLLGYRIRGPRETPLNGPIGPHRRFDQLVTRLEDARAVHRALGGTVHDVILATVAGAVRVFLQDRLVNPATLDFRVATPVSVDAQQAGDGVSQWMVELPVWERDPERRLAMICERTEALNHSNPALGARTLFSVARWTSSRLLSLGARAVSSHAPANMTVVNVPGPQVPLYLMGARLLESYGHAPLRGNEALGVTATSYDGRLCWGLTADFDRLPDLDRFGAALEASFRELVRLAARRQGRLEVLGAS